MSRSASRTQVRTSGSLSQTLRIRGRRACPWPSFPGRRWSVPTALDDVLGHFALFSTALAATCSPSVVSFTGPCLAARNWPYVSAEVLFLIPRIAERSFVHGCIHPARVRFCRDSQDACAGLSCYYKSMAECGLRI